MSALGRVSCGTCTHPGAFHVLPIGGCRRNGCDCRKFVDPAKLERDEQDTDRLVELRIPEGYELHVQIVPIRADDGS